MSDTRWVERHDAVLTFILLKPSIEATLEDISNWPGESCASDCCAYLASMMRSEFLIALMSLKHLLGATKATSIALHGASLELPQSMDHIRNLRHLFQQWRDGEGNSRYEKVHSDTAKPGDIQIEGRRGRPPVASSAYDHFRQTVYLPFLDFVLMDLKERFVGAASSCAQVCKLLPRWISEKDAKEEDFDDLVQLYEGILPDGDFPSKFEVWKNMWRFPLYTDTPETFTAALRVCDKATMPVIFTLLQIGATLPVTVCTAERSFSSMKLLKSYLRSNMKEDRLSNLALIYIHKDVEINVEEVIDRFAAKNRRLNFV